MKAFPELVTGFGMSLALAFVASTAQAQLINVNFIDDAINIQWGGGSTPAPATMSGAAVLGSAGDIWNGLGGFNYATYPTGASGGPYPLVYANGLASGVSLSLVAPNGTYDANSVNWSNFSPFSWASLANEQGNVGYPATPYANLMASCLVANTAVNDGSVTLTGLSPLGLYQLVTYNASDENEVGGRISSFTVNGVTQTSTYDGVTTTLVQGVDYLSWNAQADATGTLVINFGNKALGESDLNGLQIQLVPEPATFALVGAAMTLLLVGRRQR